MKRGRLYIIELLCCLLVTGVVLSVSAAEPGTVAVLLSESQEACTVPVEGFKAELYIPVQVYSLEGDIRRARTTSPALPRNGHGTQFVNMTLIAPRWKNSYE